MKFRRILSALTVGAVSMTCFTACGNKIDNTDIGTMTMATINTNTVTNARSLNNTNVVTNTTNSVR